MRRDMRYRRTSSVPSGLDLFVRVIDANGTGCLAELVHNISVQDESCYKYALLVLHDLIWEQRVTHLVVYLCEQRTLTQVLGWLDNDNEKLLGIVTDIVQKLVLESADQMAFFIEMNGHQKLINLVANCCQEPMLRRATRLLDKIAQTEPGRLVASGVLEALQRHMDHASQQLVRQVLACIRSVSDIGTNNRCIQPLLQKLLQLLGTSDLLVKEYCADILVNLCANNAQNKAFLVENGAVPELFQLLYELNAVRGTSAAEDDAFQRQLEGIQETALTTLKSLCTGQASREAAKQQILAHDGLKQLLMEKLREWHFGLLRRTLLLLQQLAGTSDASLLAQLRFSVTFAPRFPQFPDAPMASPSIEHCSFASQLVLLLQQFSNMLPNTTELCRLCLDTLKAMCQDGPLLEEIYVELRNRRMRITEGQGPRLLIPQLLLAFNDQLAPNAIALMVELARLPEAAQLIARHPATLDTLRRLADNNLEVDQQQQKMNNKQHQQAVQAAVRLLQLIDGDRPGPVPNGCVGQQQQCQFPQQSGGNQRHGEELSAMLLSNNHHNNSPASMDCSPAQSSSLFPQQQQRHNQSQEQQQQVVATPFDDNKQLRQLNQQLQQQLAESHQQNAMRQISAWQQQLRCQFCGEQLLDVQALQAHWIAWHVAQLAQLHVCADCGASFNTEDALRTHRQQQHTSNADGM